MQIYCVYSEDGSKKTNKKSNLIQAKPTINPKINRLKSAKDDIKFKKIENGYKRKKKNRSITNERKDHLTQSLSKKVIKRYQLMRVNQILSVKS